MKYKYVLNNGLASSEDHDMKRLSEYAKEGWILEKIAGAFFYKLKKEEPQDIIYTLDYQNDADEEYFSIMKEAGWSHVYSDGNSIHIFSAHKGTDSIYSDVTTEIDKYKPSEEFFKKGTVYTLIIDVILGILMLFAIKFSKTIFIILSMLFIIDLIALTFCSIPYVGYKSRINELRKYGKLKDKRILAYSWPMNLFASIVATTCVILHLVNYEYFGAIIMFVIDVINIRACFNKKIIFK